MGRRTNFDIKGLASRVYRARRLILTYPVKLERAISSLFRSFGEVARHLHRSDHPSRVISAFKAGCTVTVSLLPISAYSVSPPLASRDLNLLWKLDSTKSWSYNAQTPKMRW